LKLYFVVPAYNEAANLPCLIENLQQKMSELNLDFQVILINDGSSDETPIIAQDLSQTIPMLVLDQRYNRGPGAAFRRGFHQALQLCRNEDLIVSLEADNTSDLSILPAMLERMQQHNDVVLASVYGPGGRIVGASWHRKFLSWGANQVLAGLLGTKHIHTYSSFFRIYRPAILRTAFRVYKAQLIREAGFVCMVELLIKLHLLNARFAEVPMVLDGKLRQGKSKMKIMRTLRGYGRVIGHYVRGNYYATPVLLTSVPTIQGEHL
jgi:dolichol-phosphate mannosyltransferase